MNPQDLLDFFDLGKKFEKVVLVGSQTHGRVQHDEASLGPPPMVHEDEESEEDDGIEYWEQFKEKERQDILYHSKALAAEKEQSDRKTVRGSRMSGIEGGTMSILSSEVHERDSDVGVRGNAFNNAKTEVVTKSNKLTIHDDKDAILQCIENHRVTIISGFTGCGKTTKVPQFIMDRYISQRDQNVPNINPPNIIVTQPRRIAAQSVARRVCDERGWQLGNLVGYKVGLDKSNCSQDTRLLYCTSGILKKIIINKKSLTEWTHVILDEVHEREEDMDFLLLLCKKLLNTNSRNVKLILMSATISLDEFRDYFSVPIYLQDREEIDLPAVHEVASQPEHRIIMFYGDDESLALNVPEQNNSEQFKLLYEKGTSSSGFGGSKKNLTQPDFFEGPKLYDYCVEQCKMILQHLDGFEKNERGQGTWRGTVLVFLPGEAEILRVKRELQLNGEDEQKLWNILTLHSRIPSEDIQKVFRHPERTMRKVILSTNMAESSITIPDIEYVIDFCLTKILIADSETNYTSLQLCWADKQSCEQRRGRAGRVRSGRVFRLVSENFYETAIPERHDPEMTRAPLEKVVLDTKLLDFGPPKQLLALAMDPPDLNNIHKTVMHLKQIGALLTTVNNVPVKDDGDITILGELIASLPVDVRLGKLVILGHMFDVLEECVTIAAGLSSKSIFTSPMEKKLEAYANKLAWADRSFSDCFAVLNAFMTWQRHKKQGKFARAVPGTKLESEWCRTRYLQLKALRDVETTHNEIIRSLRRHGIEIFPMPNKKPLNWDLKCQYIQYCLFGAFYPNYFVRRCGNVDNRHVSKLMNGRDPMTSVYLTHFPQNQHKVAHIYAEDVKNIFQVVGSDKDRIDVEFDQSKVIVEFAKNRNVNQRVVDGSNLQTLNEENNLTGEIIHQVYVAMKMKSLRREFLAMDLLRVEEAEELAFRFQTQQQSTNASVTSEVSCDYPDMKSIGRIKPPKLNDQFCFFDVVHVNDPWSIFVHFRSHAKLLDQVEEAIDRVKNIGFVRAQGKIDLRKDQVYLAPFKDEADDQSEFFRAKIDKINPLRGGNRFEVKVTFIDYGNTTLICHNELVMITPEVQRRFPDLVQTPALALECTMAKIKPNPLRYPKQFWDDNATIYLQKIIHLETIKAEIYSVVAQSDGPLVSITIFDDNNTNINEKLLKPPKKGELPFAVETQESYMSETNHQQRKKFENYTKEWKEKLEEMQTHTFNAFSSSDQAKSSGPSIREESRSQRVYLRGPFHPLEFKMFACHRMGMTKECRIEQESVNSVLLDRYPTDQHDMFMVASSVSLNPSTSTLVLRATTFLPNIYGLGAILSMTFAPFVEMRCDQRRRNYIGCLTGLGVRDKDWGRSARTGQASKPAQKVSYYPEHDMEIMFDVDIDNEDVELINKIRYQINSALTGQTFAKGDGRKLNFEDERRERILKLSNAQDINDIQTRLQDYFNILVSKTRKSKEKQMFQRPNAWLELPDEDELLPTKLQDDEHFILKMITGIKFRQQQTSRSYKEKEWLLMSVEKFHRLGTSGKSSYVEAECPICDDNTEFCSSAEITRHIQTHSHMRALQNL